MILSKTGHDYEPPWMGLSVLDFYKGYKPPGYKNPGLQWMRIKSPSAKSRRVFKLRICLSTDKVFKSLIAKIGWIFIMILNDWGFHTGLYYSNME